MMIDRRVSRTRKALYDALLSLLLRKHYAEIEVQEIVAEANVGRSTFYEHFRSKDELLVRSLERLRPVLERGRQAQLRHPRDRSCEGTLALFRHLGEQRRLLAAIRGTPAATIVDDAIESELARFFGMYVPSGGNDMLPRQLGLGFFTGTFMSVAKWWLSRKAEMPPEEVDVLFHRLVGGGVPPGFFVDETQRRASSAAASGHRLG